MACSRTKPKSRSTLGSRSSLPLRAKPSVPTQRTNRHEEPHFPFHSDVVARARVRESSRANAADGGRTIGHAQRNRARSHERTEGATPPQARGRADGAGKERHGQG